MLFSSFIQRLKDRLRWFQSSAGDDLDLPLVQLGCPAEDEHETVWNNEAGRKNGPVGPFILVLIVASFLVAFIFFVQSFRGTSDFSLTDIIAVTAPTTINPIPTKRVKHKNCTIRQPTNFEPAGRYLLETIDTSVSPCENFYQFVCGKLTDDDDDVDRKLTERNWAALYAQMNDADYVKNAPAPIQMAISAYQKYARYFNDRTASRVAAEFEAKIVRELLQISGISSRIFATAAGDEGPTAQQLGKAIGYLASRGIFSLLYIDVAPIITTARSQLPQLVLQVRPGTFSSATTADSFIPSMLSRDVRKRIAHFREKYESDDDDDDLFYEEPQRDGNNYQTADAIVSLESRLQGCKTNNAPNISFFDNAQAFNVSQLNADFSLFDWTEIALGMARHVLGNGQRLILQYPVQLRMPHFFTKLQRAFVQNKVDRTVIAQYLIVQLLKDIEKQYFKNVPAKTIPPGLDVAFERIYADSQFPANARVSREELHDQIDDLVDAIQASWKRMIFETTAWMSPLSRQKLLLKLAAMRKAILLPAEIMDNSYLIDYYTRLNITTDDDLWKMIEKLRDFAITRNVQNIFDVKALPLAYFPYQDSVITVNAWNLPMLNSITIPLGEIPSPVYDSDWPASHAFGSLGFIIGHEIGHAFDDNNGLPFGDVGQKERQVDEETMAYLKDYSECLMTEYAELCRTMSNADLQCENSRDTIDEDMSDHSGIRAAYRAFQQHLLDADEENCTEPMLPQPELRQYDHDQLFFMFMTRSWCTQDTESSAGDHIHSSNRHRILGMLRNFPPFQKAFNCSSTSSPMVSQGKCELWI